MSEARTIKETFLENSYPITVYNYSPTFLWGEVYIPAASVILFSYTGLRYGI